MIGKRALAHQSILACEGAVMVRPHRRRLSSIHAGLCYPPPRRLCILCTSAVNTAGRVGTGLNSELRCPTLDSKNPTQFPPFLICPPFSLPAVCKTESSLLRYVFSLVHLESRSPRTDRGAVICNLQSLDASPMQQTKEDIGELVRRVPFRHALTGMLACTDQLEPRPS